MADRYLLESGAPDGYQLEDGSGVLLLDFFQAQNSAEGGSDGTTVTNGNSGGASGDAFDTAILVMGTGTPKFETDAAVTGSMGYDLGAGSSDWIGWDDVTIPAGFKTLYGRTYLKLTGDFPTTYLVLGEQTGGGTFSAYVSISTAGAVAISDNTGGTAFSTALSLNTLYRLEWKIVSHASAGTVEVRLYAGHSTSALETQAPTSRNTDGGDIRRVYIQHDGGPTTHALVDDFNTNSSEFPGPTGTDATPGRMFRRRLAETLDFDPFTVTGWR